MCLLMFMFMTRACARAKVIDLLKKLICGIFPNFVIRYFSLKMNRLYSQSLLTMIYIGEFVSFLSMQCNAWSKCVTSQQIAMWFSPYFVNKGNIQIPVSQNCRESCRYNIFRINVQKLIVLGNNLIELSNHLNHSIFDYIYNKM